MNKICRRCNEDKSLQDFNKHISMSDGHLNICKSCIKKYKANYYKNNKDGVVKDARLRNKENYKIAKRSKKYRDVRNKSRRERYITDTNYKLVCVLRSRLKAALKGKSKGIKTLETIGCSIEELKLHIEKQFKSGMSWCNHGDTWHIDHIKPISLFILPLQLKEANHYTNLQPLWLEDNLSKGKKYGSCKKF